MCKARARDYAPRRTSASNYSLTGDHRQSANSTSSDISSSTIPQSQIDNNNRRHGQYVYKNSLVTAKILMQLCRIQELVPAQPVQEGPQERVRASTSLAKNVSGLTYRAASRSPRHTDTRRSRVLTPNSDGTTDMRSTER